MNNNQQTLPLDGEVTAAQQFPGAIRHVRCISLWQPWASLMATILSNTCERCHGAITASLQFHQCPVCGGGGIIERAVKFVETRHWPTHIRGPVCIHASKTKQGITDCMANLRFEHVDAMERALGMPPSEWTKKLPFGQIIAEGNLSDCLQSDIALARYPDQEPFGNFSIGRFGHVYHNLRPIGPFPCKGAQGFFTATIPA